MNVDEFINLRQGSMSVEEYSLKFILLSKYVPSLVSNHRDEMSRFVIGVDDLVKEECHMVILNGDMTLSRLMVYAQSIEESKFGRRSRDVKRRRRIEEQAQPKFKNKSPNQNGYSSLRPTMRDVVVLKLLRLLVLLVEEGLL